MSGVDAPGICSVELSAVRCRAGGGAPVSGAPPGRFQLIRALANLNSGSDQLKGTYNRPRTTDQSPHYTTQPLLFLTSTFSLHWSCQQFSQILSY